MSNFKISNHALKRWDERCPDLDITTYLDSARPNRYHPAAVRAIAGYKAEGERKYLVCHNGIVFVVSYENINPVVVTVLLPHTFIEVAIENEIENMDVNQLKAELKKTDRMITEMNATRSQLGKHKANICLRLNAIKNHTKESK